MKNLSFVIWMLGFPLILEIGCFLSYLKDFLSNKEISSFNSGGTISIIIYIFIGYLTYEKSEKE